MTNQNKAGVEIVRLRGIIKTYEKEIIRAHAKLVEKYDKENGDLGLTAQCDCDLCRGSRNR